jgi:hypothetical protein
MVFRLLIRLLGSALHRMAAGGTAERVDRWRPPKGVDKVQDADFREVEGGDVREEEEH